MTKLVMQLCSYSDHCSVSVWKLSGTYKHNFRSYNLRGTSDSLFLFAKFRVSEYQHIVTPFSKVHQLVQG